jgi:hypothetical protein
MRKQIHKYLKLQLDTRNRVCLTHFLPKNLDISSFRAYQDGNKIILEPLVEIPAEEHWIYKNPKAMTSVMRGLEDIKEGRVSQIDRDFSEFINDDEI